MQASPTNTLTSGDASPTNLFSVSPVSLFRNFESQTPGNSYNLTEIVTDTENRPSQEIIDDLDKGGHSRDSN